ncbi:hypothetical protein [Nonomuraea sp. NPDC050643]
MDENLTPEIDETPESTEEERVPFTVEMMELDSNPIILQPKSY